MLAFATASLVAFAQNDGKITGVIKDGGSQKVIDAATISLLKAEDSALVRTSVTDKDGNFVFDHIAVGAYLVRSTSVGHLEVYSRVLLLTTPQSRVQTGVMELLPAAKSMAAVVVTAKKSFVERRADKTLINPDALISNTGANALEVLEKAPGVSVDKDGNISLKGKQGVVVMMDGKQTYMSATELAAFLTNTSAASIDQIEIMTNPSAKYDAAGNSGIINIKTKKNRQKGFNGAASISYGQGRYGSGNSNLNLNYRNGKINLFSTLSGQLRKDYQHMDIHRTYLDNSNELISSFTQDVLQKKKRNNASEKLGLDFYASPKTTLGFVWTSGQFLGIDRPENLSFFSDKLGNKDSLIQSVGRENERFYNAGVNLNLRHSFDSTGREITADLDYVNYSSNRDQLFDNTSYLPDWTLQNSDRLLGQLPSDINIYSAKTDYTHPFKKDLKLEAGLKFSYVTTDNDARYFNEIAGQKFVDYEKTNQFKYKENINAAYVNLNKTVGKWGVQAGVRLENTNYEGHQFGNPYKGDSSFKKSYTSAFPTTYLSYQASKKNQFTFSYGRRISRPGYEDLNPFLFFLDKYTYGQGNPFLKPMFSNVFEASHSYNNWLTTTLNYSRTKDMFKEIFEKRDLVFLVTQGNYGKADEASLSLNAQLKPAKWWTSMLYAEGHYQKLNAMVQGDVFKSENTNFTFNINNQFKFEKGWAAEISGWYRTKDKQGQIAISSMGQVSAGVSKQVIKTKGSIKLAVRDIFYSQKVYGQFDIKNTDADFHAVRDSRVATLSFNYRFGKPIKGLKGRKSGGVAEEQGRVKNAN